MSQFKGKWVTHGKGGPSTGFEVTVVRSDNSHGFASYGWYKEGEKVCIATSGSMSGPTVPQFVWCRLVEIANDYAAYLNHQEAIPDAQA